jgi:hypothetical protein
MRQKAAMQNYADAIARKRQIITSDDQDLTYAGEDANHDE